MVRTGSRASSPKITVASIPMKDETTNTSATLNPLEKIARGPNGATLICSGPPPVTRIVTPSSSRIAISAIMQNPRTVPLNAMLRLPAQIDRGPQTEGKDPPCDVRSAVRRYDGVGEEPEQGVYCDVDGVVGGECDERAGNTER